MYANLKRWERDYRRAAKADKYALLRDHLSKFSVLAEPETSVAATISVVQTCAAYCSIDGQAIDAFLAMQKYDSREARDATYAFTFDISGKAYARVLVRTIRGPGLDLADLYDHPWEDYKVCGYSSFWVSRNDGRDMSRREIKKIENEVTEDLRFDFSDDELDIIFDDESVSGILHVAVQDRYAFETEVERHSKD